MIWFLPTAMMLMADASFTQKIYLNTESSNSKLNSELPVFSLAFSLRIKKKINLINRKSMKLFSKKILLLKIKEHYNQHDSFGLSLTKLLLKPLINTKIFIEWLINSVNKTKFRKFVFIPAAHVTKERETLAPKSSSRWNFHKML